MLHNTNNMKKNRIKLIASLSIMAFSFSTVAKENVGGSGNLSTPVDPYREVLAGCAPATARVDIDINNVRATLLTGGDMWWDLVNAQYEIPKGSKINSIFAGSLWIGGIDNGNQLKVAAMTYRQTGNDYWPGPLDNNASISVTNCLTYDKFYKVNKADVKAYHNWVIEGRIGASPIGSGEMLTLRDWPVMGPTGEPLAPYYDYNNDGAYDVEAGDYPDFDLGDDPSPAANRACKAQLKGDQAIWWVFNDKGNVHSESGGASIGLEIQAQAFGFQTTDEINNMTFYTYKIANKSSFSLNKTHFGVWVDADLGGYNDDYVGCDVTNGFGYQYNGDAIDEGLSGVLGYGANPPAVGVDFFEGPFADINGVDDPADSTINGIGYGDIIPDNERLGMERFIYYNNNTNPVNGNPNNATDFYNYLTGKWQDGNPMTYGGDAVGAGTPCKFVFPDDSDPTGYGTGGQTQAPWSEWRENNPFVDRRFMQVAGPFTLRPGAVNVITTGVVWARATQGGPLGSLALLKGADKKAQELFNNCFKALSGPDAPDLHAQELENEIILYWTNPKGSNNYQETYTEDYNLAVSSDSLYRFQGYQIYQLKDNTVSITELRNVDRARLVYQSDLKDNVSRIINYTFNGEITANVPEEMVNGANQGVSHSISVKTDLFAPGDNKLVNHKTYYYRIIAYGYSPTQEFNPGLFSFSDFKPYIAGNQRQEQAFVAAIPHIVSPELAGTEQHADYGTGVKIRRIEGQGNGGNALEMTTGSLLEALGSTSRVLYPVYENGHGPISIKVVDPLNVPNETFRVFLYDTTSSTYNITNKARWKIVKAPYGPTDTVKSDATIETSYEQIINGQGILAEAIPKWGISITVMNGNDPASATATDNGALASASSMSFADPNNRWLLGLPDQDGPQDINWIRSGTSTETPPEYSDYTGTGTDPTSSYEKFVDGTWAPYRLTAYTTTGGVARGGPAWDQYINLSQLKNTASVDVVFTSDKSKWTRCPVIELQEDPALAIGGAKKMSIRRSPSVDKNGKKAGDSGYNANEGGMTDSAGVLKPTPTGMGWFPGYAVNIETGERLNMAFGEDSYLTLENGADMKWNPTSNVFSSNFDPIFGGKHYIYIFGHNASASFAASDALLPKQLRDIPRYDNGYTLYKLYKAYDIGSNALYKREIYIDAMWVNIPILNPGHSILENEAKVKLRVTRSYQKYGTGSVVSKTNLVVGQHYFVEVGPIKHGTPEVTYPTGSSFTATATTYNDSTSNTNAPTYGARVVTTINKANGMYEFNTADIETHTGDAASAKEALELINIVPNPYYAYSEYEKTTLDNVVKITNLPAKCTVSIYTLNGNLVRRFKRDDSGAEAKTSLDWDLKNEARIPIASGLYIIHVDVPEVGEKILKWFGVMRPIDIEAY
ncbi:MAG: hypothetical protein K0Q95_2627 [Bacteroidota bacterium]|nr:hypothetical protein [Bacteroidota bacterium]